MTRFSWTMTVLAVLVGAVLVTSVAAAPPFDPPYPARIDFPAPQFDAAGTFIAGTGYAPEGIAVSGDTFYAGSTATGEIIKGNLKTGAFDRAWVPPSPNQPSALHRGVLGLLVDDHNRLWAAGSYGLAQAGPPPVVNTGEVFVYDATSGQLLAAYPITNSPTKFINDITITNNVVYISNTVSPAGAEVQYKIQLGPGGALPPGGEVSGGEPAPTNPSPAVPVPTPGFTGADGIDTLPNGNVIMNSVTGTSNGDMVVVNATTGAVTPIMVTPEPGRVAKPLLSGDGVALDGTILYYPENRTEVALCPAPDVTLPCPGDIAAVRLNPPDYTTATVVARLNSPAGSGLPPLRSPANTEQLGHFIYVISRQLINNPVTGLPITTPVQTFIERIPKLPVIASGSAVSAVEGSAFSGSVATGTDPSTAPLTATINWGDGSPTSTGTVVKSGESFAVSGTHTYAEQGSYTVTTTVADGVTGLNLTTATATATVANAPIVVSVTPLSGIEGAALFGVVARFTHADPGATAADFTAMIDWGDGSPVSTGTVAAAGTAFAVSGSHTYADEGSYKVTANVVDDDGSTGTANGTATIADAPLTAGLIKALCSSVPCVATFGFTDANPGATVADFTATIDWGDGSSSAGLVSASGAGFMVSGSHVYADHGGGHVVTITVTDDGGSTVSAKTPAATAMLLAKKHHEDDGEDHSFVVVATCSSGTATALLNGIPVRDGDVVRLKLIKKGDQKVKREAGHLSISATSFKLVVTCTDAAGNQSSASATPVFKKRGHDEDENEFRHHSDD
jgi:hypothetical protein